MIILDYKDRSPIYEQVVERFKDLIINQVLEPDAQMPSVRSLAMDLSINPNTIQRAYAELERQGFIYTVKGKGSFVSKSSQFIQAKKEEIFQSVFKLIAQAIRIGITEDQFIIKVKDGFKEEIKND